MSVIMSCCGGTFINNTSFHEEWCPTHIRAALTWIEPTSGGKIREQAETALEALLERDGRVRAVTLPDVLPLAKRLYNEASVGCCLHLPLSAGEMDNESLRRSIQVAEQKQHAHCETLARVLLRFTEGQRTRLVSQVKK